MSLQFMLLVNVHWNVPRIVETVLHSGWKVVFGCLRVMTVFIDDVLSIPPSMDLPVEYYHPTCLSGVLGTSLLKWLLPLLLQNVPVFTLHERPIRLWKEGCHLSRFVNRPRPLPPNGSDKSSRSKSVPNELRFIRENPNDQQSKLFKLQHASWGRSARTHSKEYKKDLIDIEAVKIYALEHPGKSAKSIKEDRCLTLSPQSICNIIHREKVRKGLPKNLAEIVEQRTHHVLGSDGDGIVVFGLSSSFHLLSSTRLVQGDGTFTCVVNPFTQFYILHGPLQN